MSAPILTWLAARRAPERLGLALLAGLVSALGFEPINLWPLTIAGVAGLILLLGSVRHIRLALATGWLWGFGHFVASLYWIAHAFQFQANMPAWLGWVAVPLLSMVMAIYPAAAAGIAWRVGRDRPAVRVLALVGGWMLTEWVRGYLFGGFPWNPLGVVLLPVFGLPHAAAVIGGLGLSGLAVAAGGALALALTGGPGRELALRIVGMLAAVGVAGQLWAGQVPAPAARPTPLRIVQANIPQSSKWDPAAELANLTRYFRLTEAAQRAAPPGLVIWPEGALTYILDEEPALRAQLGALLRPGDLLITGGDKALRGADGRAVAARNSLWVVAPTGRIRARYDKSVLVPFGEYLPLRSVLTPLGVARLVPGSLDFWPGPGPRTLRLPGYPPVGPQICYEIVVSGNVVDGRDRPAWILNASNDAWFSDGGAWMHLAQARLRAIEEGLPVVRATPTGVSAIIDAHGRVVASLGRDRAGVLTGVLPAPLERTPFGRIGPALPLLLALAAVAGAIAQARRGESSGTAE